MNQGQFYAQHTNPQSGFAQQQQQHYNQQQQQQQYPPQYTQQQQQQQYPPQYAQQQYASQHQPQPQQQQQQYYAQPTQPADHYAPQGGAHQQTSAEPKYMETSAAPVHSHQVVEQMESSQGGWKDVWAAVLWGASWIVMIVLFAMKFQQIKDLISFEDGNSNPDAIDLPILKTMFVCLGACVFGFVWGVVWVWVMKRFAGAIIKLMMVLTVVVWLANAGIMLYFGSIYAGVIWLLFGLVLVWYYYVVRRRIPFAVACLKVAGAMIQEYPATVGVAVAFVLLEVAWVAFWVLTMLGVFENTSGGGNSSRSYAALGLLVPFYWTTQVFRNIVVVTSSGVAATWYFVSDPKNPTAHSFKRATTTSLGSICFGSLLVALLQTFRAMVRSNDNGSCANMICQCILACIQNLLEYFNKYAFAQVAIFGKSFVQAAKDTWSMFKQKGIDAVVNDDLTGLVLGLGTFLGAALCGVAIGALSQLDDELSEDYVWLLEGLVALLVAWVVISLIMGVVESFIVTLFVCWSEDPAAFGRSRPHYYNVMVEGLSKMYDGRIPGL